MLSPDQSPDLEQRHSAEHYTTSPQNERECERSVEGVKASKRYDDEDVRSGGDEESVGNDDRGGKGTSGGKAKGDRDNRDGKFMPWWKRKERPRGKGFGKKDKKKKGK